MDALELSMGMRARQNVWLFCVALFATNAAYAQVFAHKTQAEYFEAVVTQDRLMVKERYQGTSIIFGDLSCPLGPAVKATVLPMSTGGRLCFNFAKERCGYTRFQNGNAIHKEELANAQRPRMCIALANAQDAQSLATLVNAGPQQNQERPVAPTTPTTARNDVAVASAAPAQPMIQATTSAVAIPQQQGAGKPEARSMKQEQEKATAKRFQVAKAGNTPHAGDHVERQKSDVASGKWITGWFTITLDGNPRLMRRTYANASIVDDSGAPSSPGGHLYLRNESGKYPLYYGISNAAKDKLEPGQQVTLALPSKRSADVRTQQRLTLRWFDEAE